MLQLREQPQCAWARGSARGLSRVSSTTGMVSYLYLPRCGFKKCFCVHCTSQVWCLSSFTDEQHWGAEKFTSFPSITAASSCEPSLKAGELSLLCHGLHSAGVAFVRPPSAVTLLEWKMIRAQLLLEETLRASWETDLWASNCSHVTSVSVEEPKGKIP